MNGSVDMVNEKMCGKMCGYGKKCGLVDCLNNDGLERCVVSEVDELLEECWEIWLGMVSDESCESCYECRREVCVDRVCEWNGVI